MAFSQGECYALSLQSIASNGLFGYWYGRVDESGRSGGPLRKPAPTPSDRGLWVPFFFLFFPPSLLLLRNPYGF